MPIALPTIYGWLGGCAQTGQSMGLPGMLGQAHAVVFHKDRPERSDGAQRGEDRQMSVLAIAHSFPGSAIGWSPTKRVAVCRLTDNPTNLYRSKYNTFNSGKHPYLYGVFITSC